MPLRIHESPRDTPLRDSPQPPDIPPGSASRLATYTYSNEPPADAHENLREHGSHGSILQNSGSQHEVAQARSARYSTTDPYSGNVTYPNRDAPTPSAEYTRLFQALTGHGLQESDEEDGDGNEAELSSDRNPPQQSPRRSILDDYHEAQHSADGDEGRPEPGFYGHASSQQRPAAHQISLSPRQDATQLNTPYPAGLLSNIFDFGGELRRRLPESEFAPPVAMQQRASLPHVQEAMDHNISGHVSQVTNMSGVASEILSEHVRGPATVHQPAPSTLSPNASNLVEHEHVDFLAWARRLYFQMHLQRLKIRQRLKDEQRLERGELGSPFHRQHERMASEMREEQRRIDCIHHATIQRLVHSLTNEGDLFMAAIDLVSRRSQAQFQLLTVKAAHRQASDGCPICSKTWSREDQGAETFPTLCGNGILRETMCSNLICEDCLYACSLNNFKCPCCRQEIKHEDIARRRAQRRRAARMYTEQ
ncbi:hypothetical protein CLAFUW4_07473 [Fulvia fulva]|uniref:RING-type domain-containing protein n=1 Tax=Passalora fulva TaxID=5499 RepID=A0A9Q8UR28_PASFU|nr:uncharacterized protein CLAFUR5_07603 [Fulvia fulva]UJO19313.1 hypothetical protein CLAFUR5_07603 [Fulvia fulva]WPV16497.1 hypothetical protein CLAFUW4_07473 [Fulvia fulva]WPV31640.1 hypothetical protein CLAFUW7_07475 [Fulvia fulva]